MTDTTLPLSRFKVLDLTLGIRVSEEEEQIGLDVTQHGERAYVLEEAGAIPAAPQASPPPPPPPPPAKQPPESAGSEGS